MKPLKIFLCFLIAFSVLGLGMIQPVQAQSLTIEKTWGGKYKDDMGLDVTVDSSGSIYVTGGTYSPSRTLQDISETETEPDGTETYAGGYDVFLLVFTLP